MEILLFILPQDPDFLIFVNICPIYNKEPHVFRADINRSEVKDSFQLASDWIKFAPKIWE